MGIHALKYILALHLCLSLSSCSNLIYDSEGDCETVYELQFVYDHNMKWADAFGSEVDAVTLHVFDSHTGHHILSTTEKGDELKREGYTMKLELPAGDYDMTAWCGLGAHDEGVSFSIPEVDHEQTRREHLTCRMSRTPDEDGNGGIVKIENGLNSLFHGHISTTLPEGDGLKVRLKMPLVKNTNNITIVLQSLSGKVIDPSMYEFTIQDNNGLMDCDNNILPDENITYHSWSVSGGSAEIIRSGETEAEDNESGKTMSAVVANLTTGRLMSEHKPILTVRSNTADNPKILFRIPVIDYALMVKGNYNQPISDQEYLDRQDEYNMTFFLDENGEWLRSYIYINKWKVVVEDFDID